MAATEFTFSPDALRLLAVGEASSFIKSYANSLMAAHQVNGKWGRAALDKEGRGDFDRLQRLANELDECVDHGWQQYGELLGRMSNMRARKESIREHGSFLNLPIPWLYFYVKGRRLRRIELVHATAAHLRSALCVPRNDRYSEELTGLLNAIEGEKGAVTVLDVFRLRDERRKQAQREALDQ